MLAEFSDCGTYRYILTRKLSTPLRWVKPMLFIMLNPSTADAIKNDPTIRRCISFAERHQCTDLTVVNLFALKSTDPKNLLKHKDPIGPLNDQRIKQAIEAHRLGFIVAAWGSHPFAQERANEIRKRFAGQLLCLGKTKKGCPRHPLYVKSDQPLENLE